MRVALVRSVILWEDQAFKMADDPPTGQDAKPFGVQAGFYFAVPGKCQQRAFFAQVTGAAEQKPARPSVPSESTVVLDGIGTLVREAPPGRKGSRRFSVDSPAHLARSLADGGPAYAHSSDGP